MKEWLRFAVCYWHTWRGNGADIFGLTGTCVRPWENPADSPLDAALNRVDVHFEFCQKLGVDFYCFHDRDVSPEGATVAESEAFFDTIADKVRRRDRSTRVDRRVAMSVCRVHECRSHTPARRSTKRSRPNATCVSRGRLFSCVASWCCGRRVVLCACDGWVGGWVGGSTRRVCARLLLASAARGEAEGDGHQAALGHRQPLLARALHERRVDQPGPRDLRARRGAGQEGDGGDAPARRPELRPLGRARGLPGRCACMHALLHSDRTVSPSRPFGTRRWYDAGPIRS